MSNPYLEVLFHEGQNWYVITKTKGGLYRTMGFEADKAAAVDYVSNHPWIVAKRCDITFDGCTQELFFEDSRLK